MKNQAVLILGDQLFPPSAFKRFQGMKAFMAEDRGLCTHFAYHQKKLVLFLSAMRHFRDERKNDLKISYSSIESDGSYLDKLSDFARENQIALLHHFEIEDKFFESQIQDWASTLKIELKEHLSPGFFVTRDDFKTYLSKSRKPFQKNFL